MLFGVNNGGVLHCSGVWRLLAGDVRGGRIPLEQLFACSRSPGSSTISLLWLEKPPLRRWVSSASPALLYLVEAL